MKRIFALFILLTSLVYAGEPKAGNVPVVSLFVVHEPKVKGDAEVVTPSKSSKGFVAARPDMELPGFADVVHLVPKVLSRDADGKPGFVDSEADLLLNLNEAEWRKLTALHKKVGDARLYLRIQQGGTIRYFDAEFAPVKDGTIFVEGTAGEKRELAKLLKRLITPSSK